MHKKTSKNQIKDWPQSERPRERMLRYGLNKVSDAELLAILLRSGIPGKDAVSLSRELISHFSGLRGVLSANMKELKRIKGLGLAKITTLVAVREIARRGMREGIINKSVIKEFRDVIDYLSYSLRDRKREVFKVIFLDKSNRILDEKDLFEGTVDSATVHIREVVKSALDLFACGVVFVHNHPSGRVQPSDEDIQMTQRLQEACETVSIHVLDHIIVAGAEYYSFRGAGII